MLIRLHAIGNRQLEYLFLYAWKMTASNKLLREQEKETADLHHFYLSTACAAGESSASSSFIFTNE